MKRVFIITLVTSLSCMPAFALAGGDPQRTLAPVTVQQGPQSHCTPPSSDAACVPLHRQIRHVFSKREIDMLFGARTAYPEYLTAYSRVSQRYRAFMHDVDTYGEPRVALVIR